MVDVHYILVKYTNIQTYGLPGM